MLFSTTTDITSNLGSVASSAFSDVGTYVILILGVILGFFIIERIIKVVFPKQYQQNEV